MADILLCLASAFCGIVTLIESVEAFRVLLKRGLTSEGQLALFYSHAVP